MIEAGKMQKRRFRIGGDISQSCAPRSARADKEVVYFRSSTPVTMVVNVYNASSACILTARLKDKAGRILIEADIQPRMTALDPVLAPQEDVQNQAKTLMAACVRELTIACRCMAEGCVETTLCAGRYWGEVE